MVKHGPKFMEVALAKAARDMVPEGASLADVVEVMLDPHLWGVHIQAGVAWTEEAIRVLRAAPDNPWPDYAEEELAGVILARLAQRQAEQRGGS